LVELLSWADLGVLSELTHYCLVNLIYLDKQKEDDPLIRRMICFQYLLSLFQRYLHASSDLHHCTCYSLHRNEHSSFLITSRISPALCYIEYATIYVPEK
jgi:hypothetical protein